MSWFKCSWIRSGNYFISSTETWDGGWGVGDVIYIQDGHTYLETHIQIELHKDMVSNKKQGLRWTRKLQICTNWNINLRICELAKASNKKNWPVQLVYPAGLSSWPVKLANPAGPSSWSVQLPRRYLCVQMYCTLTNCTVVLWSHGALASIYTVCTVSESIV